MILFVYYLLSSEEQTEDINFHTNYNISWLEEPNEKPPEERKRNRGMADRPFCFRDKSMFDQLADQHDREKKEREAREGKQPPQTFFRQLFMAFLTPRFCAFFPQL